MVGKVTPKDVSVEISAIAMSTANKTYTSKPWPSSLVNRKWQHIRTFLKRFILCTRGCIHSFNAVVNRSLLVRVGNRHFACTTGYFNWSASNRTKDGRDKLKLVRHIDLDNFPAAQCTFCRRHV